MTIEAMTQVMQDSETWEVEVKVGQDVYDEVLNYFFILFIFFFIH